MTGMDTLIPGEEKLEWESGGDEKGDMTVMVGSKYRMWDPGFVRWRPQ